MSTSEHFQQLAVRFTDPIQHDYEVIRGILLADETIAERSRITGVDRGTVSEKARRFVQHGMFGLIDQRTTPGSSRHHYPDVVADCFYGEDHGVQQGIRDLGKGYVLALKPSHAWWHPIGSVGSLQEAAGAAGWQNQTAPGAWVQIERSFRDGHTETWWALEVTVGPYGPEKSLRAVVATTDPATLPEHRTWYLTTNLPAPGSARAREADALPPADLAEIIRLYGLRNWVEQSYKETKGALGWSDYQVRSDRAIRRHWTLVCCAFSFCWYHHSRSTESGTHPAQADPVADETTGRGENGAHAAASAASVLASRAPGSAGVVGTVDSALALLDRVVESAPTSTTPVAA